MNITGLVVRILQAIELIRSRIRSWVSACVSGTKSEQFEKEKWREKYEGEERRESYRRRCMREGGALARAESARVVSEARRKRRTLIQGEERWKSEAKRS